MIWAEEVKIKKSTRRRRHNLDIYSKDKEYLKVVLQSYGHLSLNRNENEEVKVIKTRDEAIGWHVFEPFNVIWDICEVEKYIWEGRKWYRLRLYVYDEGQKEILSGLDLKKIEKSKVKRAYYKEP